MSPRHKRPKKWRSNRKGRTLERARFYRETKPMTFDEASASLRKHQVNQIKSFAREFFGVDVEVGEFSLSVVERAPILPPSDMSGNAPIVMMDAKDLLPHDQETRT